MNHPQPPTKMKTDNSTADGFVNSTIKEYKSNTMQGFIKIMNEITIPAKIITTEKERERESYYAQDKPK